MTDWLTPFEYVIPYVTQNDKILTFIILLSKKVPITSCRGEIFSNLLKQLKIRCKIPTKD